MYTKYLQILTVLVILTSCTDLSKVDNGTRIVYYPGTKLKQQEVEMKDGRKNGVAKEYYRNGNLKRLQHYINDTLNDSSMYYHPNGVVSNQQYFKNKQKEGCWRDYNKEGRLVAEMNFKNNELDGISTKYTYRTGRMQLKVNYKEGSKDGLEEQYYPNGNIKSRIYYKNGSQCTDIEEYSQNGKPINNDFKITVKESNEVLLKNTLTYYITLSNPHPDDYVYMLFSKPKDNCSYSGVNLKKSGNSFIQEYTLSKGGFVMEKVTIAAFRKTAFGNNFVKLHEFTAAANNF